MRALRTRLGLAPNRAGEAALVPHAPSARLREIVRRFWPDARRYRRWLVVGLVPVILAPAIDTARIWLFKLVVDDVLVPRDFGPLLWIAVAYVGLTVAAGVVGFADDLLATWIGERFLLSLRTRVFEHLQGLSLDFFERRRLGDVLSRLTGDVAAIENFVLSGVANALAYVLQIVFFVTALFILRWDLALVSLFVAPLFWLTARRFSRLIKHASREKRRRSGSLSAVAEESLANVALVQAYGREETEVQRFRREGEGAYEAELAATRLRALFGPLVELIEVAGALIVIAAGTWELTRGRLSLGGLLVFIAYLSQLYAPIRGLARLSNSLYSASAGAERVLELLDERPTITDRPHARSLQHVRGEIDFEDVVFAYPGADRPALDAVSFRAEPGEIVALVGPSGAGKSTVAKLLLRFYDPASGAVFLDGVDVRELTLQSLRAQMAVLLQETLVLDGTVRDNIAFGRPDATAEEIARAARDADAAAFIDALPDGYSTRVGQRGRRLSGGQRQRLAIARAMVRKAPILVLDEPTTSLDAASADRIVDLLRRLMEGRTTLVISHNLLTVRHADSILVLENGVIHERGTHAELLELDGSYAQLWRRHLVDGTLPGRV